MFYWAPLPICLLDVTTRDQISQAFPSYLHNASDPRLEVGTDWEQGYPKYIQSTVFTPWRWYEAKLQTDVALRVVASHIQPASKSKEPHSLNGKSYQEFNLGISGTLTLIGNY